MTKYRSSDLQLLEQLAILESRESFGAYRRYIRPGLKSGWFVKTFNYHLQQFYNDLIAGKRPKLAIEAPPQHGKSTGAIDFVTWLAGRHPELKVIYTSFSERLGVRANLQCQRIYTSTKYKRIFPETRVSNKGNTNTFGATRNRELIEYIEKEGYFRNTTVRGSITGESLDLGIIDDPIKGREAANSETVRDATWEWMTDDFMTRFSDGAGLLMIMTRWHVDDPLSRLQQELNEELKVIKYRAIATENELYRREGEPLFPEHKSIDFLNGIKKTMSSASWESLYQQNPRIIGGEIIKPEWFKYYKVPPRIIERYIYGDTAQKTKERNDYSVFGCFGRGVDNNVYLLDLIRGKWEAPELRRKAVAFWMKHKSLDSYELGSLRKMKIEDKASGTGLIQELRSGDKKDFVIPIDGIERHIDKYTRVLDIIGYIESGYFFIPESDVAPWVNDFVNECEAFTADDSHMYDDQIDIMTDALKDLMSSGNVLALWSKLGQ